jgi:hypothetical protein
MHRVLVLLILSTLATGCGAPPKDTSAPPPVEVAPPPARAWTAAFEGAAVLLADEIHVEGPQGLLDHLAMRQDSHTTEYSAETTAAGFRQTMTLRAGAEGAEIRGQLDAWQLVALQRLIVLERPDHGAVVIRARGEAFWRSAGDGRERRGPELAFRGEPGR